jgi:hypothetical protein
VPPHPESTGIVTGTKVAIQDDAVYAIVTARQQIRISIAQGVSHVSQLDTNHRRVLILASGFLGS